MVPNGGEESRNITKTRTGGRKLSELDFVLQLDQMGTERPVHHNKLKLYEGDNPPRWVLKAKKKLSSHCSARQ